MENWIQKAITQWQFNDIKLNHGTTEAELQNAEALLGFQFPEDFKELYLVVNGFEDYEDDENGISLWSLGRITTEYGVDGEKDIIYFCDYLISCWEYFFSKSRPGIYKDYDSSDDKPFITGFFRHFISEMNKDSDLLY